MVRLIAAAALCGLATGCVTPNPNAQSVRISSSVENVKGCKFLEQANFDAHALPAAIIRDDVVNKMKNRAVEIGGTDVISPGPSVTAPGPIATMNGDIYRCG